jgi:hypothetical protein
MGVQLTVDKSHFPDGDDRFLLPRKRSSMRGPSTGTVDQERADNDGREIFREQGQATVWSRLRRCRSASALRAQPVVMMPG